MFTPVKSFVARKLSSRLAAFALALLPALGMSLTAHAWYPYVQQTAAPSVCYNPYTGQMHVHVDQQVAYPGAYDPNRGVIDAGSARRVDRYVYNGYGQLVRETGYEWTSFGVPHSQLTQNVVQPAAVATTGYYGYSQPVAVGSTTTTYQRSAAVAGSGTVGRGYARSNRYGAKNGTSVTRSYSKGVVPRN